MIQKLLLFFLIFTSAHSFPARELRTKIITIYSNSYYRDLAYLRSIEMDILGVDINQNLIDLHVSKGEEDLLLLEGFTIKTKRSTDRGIVIDPRYKTGEEVEQFLVSMNQNYPNLTKIEVIGKTHEKRDIFAIKISDNPSFNETSEPAILFNSLHHAREVMTVEVALDIVEYLLTNYDNIPEVKHWVDSNEIWVVPMLNVDGSNKVWTSYPMWRKNTAFNGHGVDLNRNYPFNWNKCNGSSGSRWSEDFRGPSPASELETNGLMNLVSKIKPVFNISYHSYSQLVIYPLGCLGEKVENIDVVEGIGKELGTILNYRAGTAWEILYSADGTDIDWMYGEHQVIPYVLELSSRYEGFFPDYDKSRDKTVLKNRNGWQHILKRLDGPGVRGSVTVKGETVNDYIINIIQAEKELYSYKGNPDGTFHIILTTGEYILNFKGPSINLYKEVTIKEKRVNLHIVSM